MKESKVVKKTSLRSQIDDGYDSEDFLDLPLSNENDDAPLKNYSLHKQFKDIKEYKWQEGTLYVSRDKFKECATNYAVHTRRGLKFKKCDKRKVKVVCQEKKMACLLLEYMAVEKLLQQAYMQQGNKYWNHVFQVVKKHEYKVVHIDKKGLQQMECRFDQVQVIRRNLNNQILPIAYVVKAETKDFQTWLVQNLYDDLDVDKIRHCTFTKIFRNPAQIDDVSGRGGCNKFKKLTYSEAYRYLMVIQLKCDVLVNNMREYFDSIMVEVREKSIISMLEDIRVYLMNKWTDNRDCYICRDCAAKN
ncbi:hypothetical protein Ahy_A10g048181 [Arachis hypogaea]|uniref:Uncharacterized protein n=1 Tax=Arachis hypogaea TaxID=3818 RepID=A0A445B4H6_ARAHY|nr:hypothetical protein Ahy_A10g048181 [Arachis hypogaea]